jgi:hypothetical protein
MRCSPAWWNTLDLLAWPRANGRLKFDKRGQLFIRTHNEPTVRQSLRSVSSNGMMRVTMPVESKIRISPEQMLCEAHPDGGKYRAMLEEAAERQHSGEERRDDYYRELAESDYASTVAGNESRPPV